MCRRQSLNFLCLAAISAAAVGCGTAPSTGGGDASGSGGPLKVVATTGMVADLLAAVGGDRVEVTTMVPQGADPHLYKPVTDDVRMLRAADVVAVSGLGLEGQMGEILLSLEEKGTTVISVGEALPEGELLMVVEEGHDGAVDPHVWTSPAFWSGCVDAVVETLSADDPDGADTFKANGEAYAAEIAALDAFMKEAIATLPESARKLVTAHDAFSYFARDYGVEVAAVQGITTESEAGLADIKALVDLIVDSDIKAVFIESTISPRTIEALIEGAAARGHEVALGGELYADAVGPPGTYEGTYLGMMDHNVTTIVGALGGEVPEGGRLGKLGAGEAMEAGSVEAE